MLTDIEIAQATVPEAINKIADAAGIPGPALTHFGQHVAKVDPTLLPATLSRGKLILVTAMSPTPAGIGKTVTTIGLADALSKIGEKVMLALREPSLGPVFGVKGGAAGGGYAQVLPMEGINLHFTGDLHAVTSANNLLAALVDNHIYQGNELGIAKVVWRRCLDVNDRQLRNIIGGVGGRPNGIEHPSGFDITAASEVMAVLCLAADLADLKVRLAQMVVGYTAAGIPVTVDQLGGTGAMAAVLLDALRPNLVQTLEQTPAFVHGGPFANIAHGANSVIATKAALQLADYVVTEAGFGADLGAEKFFDIVCRQNDLQPDAVVIVATIAALKWHGEGDLHLGLANLMRHVNNVTKVFGLPATVAINRFPNDTDTEIALLQNCCRVANVRAVLSEVWARGSDGGLTLAEEVLHLVNQPSTFRFAYDLDLPLANKIEAVAARIYRAERVLFTREAQLELNALEELGYGGLPVCIAKTQFSFSGNAKLLGAPESFDITVRGARVSAGAGFVVVLSNDIMTMPGLPKVPAATGIDVDSHGMITGLF